MRNERTLLAGGETPWHALKELALALYNERESPKGPSVPVGRREMSVRVFESPVYPTREPRYVAEAKWEPDWTRVRTE